MTERIKCSGIYQRHRWSTDRLFEGDLLEWCQRCFSTRQPPDLFTKENRHGIICQDHRFVEGWCVSCGIGENELAQIRLKT